MKGGEKPATLVPGFQNYTSQVQTVFKTGISEETALNHILGLVSTREEIARLKDEISGWLKDNQSLDFSSQTEGLNESNRRSMNLSLKLYKELLKVENFSVLGLSPEQIKTLLIDLRNLEEVVEHLKSEQKKNECQRMIKLLDYSLNQALPKQPLLLAPAKEEPLEQPIIDLQLPDDFFGYFDEQDAVPVEVRDRK